MSGEINKFTHVAKGVFFFVFALFLIVMMVRSPFDKLSLEVTEQPYARSISVMGEGEVTVKPDMAIANVSVVSEGRTVKAVTQDGNEKMGRIVTSLKGLGVHEDDITTTAYNLNPRYNYPRSSGTRVLDGYTLTQNVRLKVRDLTLVENVLDTAVEEGANQLGQLSFEMDDDSEARRQAREKAFADAREKAEMMAAAAGVRLGKVVTFSESGNYGMPMYARSESVMAMDMAVEESFAPSIEVGSQDVTLSVNVTYEIE